MVGRPPSGNPKRNVIAVRVTDRDLKVIDSQRGALSRAEWVRWLLLQWRKQG